MRLPGLALHPGQRSLHAIVERAPDERTPGSPSRRAAAAALVAALAVGFGLGRCTAPAPSPPRPAPAPLAQAPTPPSTAPAESPSEPDASGDQGVIEYLMAANAALAEELRALGSIVDGLDSGVSATPVARAAIRMLPERDVRSLVRAATSFTDDDLDEVGDVRAFANRLLTIAADGTFDSESSTPFARDVEFGTTARTPLSEGLERFPSGQGRIYAFFDDPDYEGHQVVSRWYNRSTGTLVLMDRYSVRSDRTRDYVWGRIDGGWEPGEYQVEFYSADAELRPLASGRFRVEEDVRAGGP